MRESSNLEFKEKNTKSFLKTVSAFSNYNGGKIIFGIDDKGVTIGLDNPEQTALDIENMINDSISPNPNFKLEIDLDNKLIILNVSEGKHKPYYYSNKAYVRHGTSTVELDRLELNALILEGSNQTYDALESLKEDLNFDYLGIKLKKANVVDELSMDILRTLELYNNKFSAYTVAGELFSDNNDIASVDIARFGNSTDIILERVEPNSKSILEQFDQAIKLYKSNYQFEKIEGTYRNKHELIPEEAFREALANSLVHRRLDMSANSQIAMYPDRIELTSPGGLPPGLTEDDYLNGQITVIRNPIVANLFYRLDIIEKFGTGIKRIKDAYQETYTSPIFKITENFITVVLPVIGQSNLTEDEKLLFELISLGVDTTSGLAKSTGFGRSKVVSIINDLIEKNLIKRLGAGRSTHYIVMI